MKTRLIIPLVAVLLLACSSDDSIYDTTANPDNFPPIALEVINDIQDGRYRGLDSISEAFGRLYTEESDLLDNQAWKQVVSRMGLLFARRGDSLEALGLPSFTAASEYYQLAAFARPEDSLLSRTAMRFGSWLEAARSDRVDLTALTGETTMTADNLIGILRFFLLSDTTAANFYETRLKPVIKERAVSAGILENTEPDQLQPTDRALLTVAGLIPENPSAENLTTFGQPEIDLRAAALNRIDSITYLAEFYFIPRQPIDSPLKVVLRLEYGDTNPVSYDIFPQPPATDWTPDEMVVVSHRFRYGEPVSSASIALVETRSSGIRNLMPDGSRTHFWSLGEPR